MLKTYTGTDRAGEEYTRYFQTNPAALEAFQKRRDGGMNLSDRVWNLSEEYRVELEDAISAAIAPGQSAQALSMEVRKCLNEPDLMFRRFRYKNEEGIWKRKWKKRYTDDEGNVRFIDCDRLAGKYPKDFKFTGWHPQCMCYCIPILKTEEEFWAYDPENPMPSENEVTELPPNFNVWKKENRELIESAEKRGKLPYFIRDNREDVEEVLKPKEPEIPPHYGAAMKLGRSATKEAMKVVENIGAPELSEIQKKNIRELADALGIPRKEVKPMSFLDADQGASNPKKYRDNCQSVVVAFEARRRGLDCYALSYSSNPESISYALGERFQDAWINPKTGKTIEPAIFRGKTDEEIISKLRKGCNSDGRYILGVNYKDGRGHVISIDRIEGKFLLADEQENDFYNLDGLQEISYLELLKIDKAVLNIEMVKSIIGFHR